jgi:hypothetical protein
MDQFWILVLKWWRVEDRSITKTMEGTSTEPHLPNVFTQPSRASHRPKTMYAYGAFQMDDFKRSSMMLCPCWFSNEMGTRYRGSMDSRISHLGDILWQDCLFLGNGDGTFQASVQALPTQTPQGQGLPAAPPDRVCHRPDGRPVRRPLVCFGRRVTTPLRGSGAQHRSLPIGQRSDFTAVKTIARRLLLGLNCPKYRLIVPKISPKWEMSRPEGRCQYGLRVRDFCLR